MRIHDYKFASIDYEYSRGRDKNVGLVCCSIKLSDTNTTHNFWLQDGLETSSLNHFISSLKASGYKMLAYMAVAEGRALLSHGIDPLDFEWADMYCEWACLTNHNHKMAYGRQLKDGKEVFTKPPKNKYGQTEEDSEDANNSKPDKSLAACLYKLLGVKVDTEHKTAMRDIIIRGDRAEIEANRKYIQDYCASDVAYLYPALLEAVKFYKANLLQEDFRNVATHIFNRGEWSVRTAHIEHLGYGIDLEATRNFSDNVKFILEECQREINSFFPNHKIFRWDKKELKFKWMQKETRQYIRELYPDLVGRWKLTDKGEISLSLDAFKEFFDFRHDYPTDNWGAQIVRYLTLKQNMNGFMPVKEGSDKKTFWDSVGDDGMVRPFLGLYGSQSARNQPSSTGFLFLKSAWMRALCKPPEGKMYVGIDYGSEEFLIGGLLSSDMNMINAYHSGDPYLYFGKAAKAIPADGTKESHSALRDKFKSTTLGIQYLMAKMALANKLTIDTKVPHTPKEAQDLIDLFDEVFDDYSQARRDWVGMYEEDGYLMVPDGWVMWGDNDNFRSVANFGVQCLGSVVLRRAVRYLQDANIEVFKTLHDACYCVFDVGDWEGVDRMAMQMQRAFTDCFDFLPPNIKKLANIRVDANAWGTGLGAAPSIITPNGMKVKTQEIYIDGRAKKQYETFSKYFKISLADMIEVL